jgi:hypothetical protein
MPVLMAVLVVTVAPVAPRRRGPVVPVVMPVTVAPVAVARWRTLLAMPVARVVPVVPVAPRVPVV